MFVDEQNVSKIFVKHDSCAFKISHRIDIHITFDLMELICYLERNRDSFSINESENIESGISPLQQIFYPLYF